MDSTRAIVLQQELTRIEEEAEAKSLAIMNKVDDLVDATYLCNLINAGLPTEQRIDPSVLYINACTADVSIFIHDYGLQVLRRAAEIELTWENNGPVYKGVDGLRFHSFERIEVRIRSNFVTAYFESLKTAA